MDKKNPLISFVIPVYKKTPEIFERCLKSLFDMSYKAIEVICVFDGPDAELEAVANRFKTKMVVIEHGGAPKARNAGAEIATGDYISFWDADCYAKPEMAKRWIEEFETTGADFVYSGYEFSDRESNGGIQSYPFDEYQLECGNYIASMFPIKREKAPRWDESLKAAQDWDFWLQAVRAGCKGSFIQGFGFITEAPTRDSISGQGWSDENYKDTLSVVQKKHGIPVRDIAVGSEMEPAKGLEIAKVLDADFNQFLDFRHHDYKMALTIGFGMNVHFRGAPKDCVKALYWLPWDITCMEQNKYSDVLDHLGRIKENVQHHFVNEIVSQKRLKRIFDHAGIPAPEVLAFPGAVEGAQTSLPPKFRVLLDIHEQFRPAFKSIKQDLPYLEFDELDWRLNPTAKPEDYSLLVSFYPHPTVDDSIRWFLVNGRHVISNVQAPYCGKGYVDLKVGVNDMKNDLIRKIREARELPFNREASEYYKAEVNPRKFRSRIYSLLPKPEMAVLA